MMSLAQNVIPDDHVLSKKEAGILTFLTLQLNPFLQVGINLDCVEEVFTLAVDDFTLMPNMAEFVLGLIYHRNQLIWAVDLGNFLGLLPPRSALTEYGLAVIFAHQTPLAFAVQNIGGLLRVAPDGIQSVPELLNPPPIVTACAQGYLGNEEAPTFLLKGEALIQTVLQKSHSHS